MNERAERYIEHFPALGNPNHPSWAGIPERMRGGIIRYVLNGIEPGDFLCAVIRNNLAAAVGRADEENVRLLPEYVKFFYNFTPSNCWGTPEIYDAWLDSFREKAEA
jgi:hypothetical protein